MVAIMVLWYLYLHYKILIMPKRKEISHRVPSKRVLREMRKLYEEKQHNIANTDNCDLLVLLEMEVDDEVAGPLHLREMLWGKLSGYTADDLVVIELVADAQLFPFKQGEPVAVEEGNIYNYIDPEHDANKVEIELNACAAIVRIEKNNLN